MPSPSVSDHLRPDADRVDDDADHEDPGHAGSPGRADDPGHEDYADGVYRVVGTDDERVTLLRVADADGRRAHTGEVVRVDREALRGFEPTAEPAGRRSLQRAAASALETAYWSGRAFVREVAAHPFPSVVALAFVAVGLGGDGVVPVPDVVLGASIFVGSLALAYVGSGRL